MVDFVYLDNHTACKPFAEVMEKWKRFSDDYWASASSLHFLGQQQIHPIQKSLDSLFLELGLGPQDELVLTKEGLSSVLLAVYLQVSRETGKTLFLTAQGQEGGNLKAFDLIEQLGCQKKLLPFNEQGQLTRDTLSSFLTAKTALVSLPWANGLTGVIHPVLDLLEACSEKKVLVHLDATYMLGKQFFRFQDLPVDFLTLRGAALYAPKGAEIILVKKGSISCPFSIESTALLGAYSSAVQAVQGHFEVFCMEIARLKDRLEQ